jgi:hypothetical protein
VTAVLAAALVVPSDTRPRATDATGAAALSAARPVPTTLRTLPLTGPDSAATPGIAPGTESGTASGTASAPQSRSAAPAPDADPGASVTAPSRERSLRTAARTPQLSTKSFSLAAVTWKGAVAEDDLIAYARTRSNGRWTPWFALANESGEHAPDPGSAEAKGTRGGTSPLLSAPSDGVQVRVDTRGGTAPTDLRIDLVDPGTSPADANPVQLAATTTAPATSPTTATAPTTATPTATGEAQLAAAPAAYVSLSSSPKPTIRSRAAWGADESKVKGAPGYGTVKGAFVHHTVNSNNYTEAQVPGLIRSIYAFHVDSRGWDDIGYNFIVDRFGRIWEGRAGGVDRAVIGAHTAGYNSVGFAMATLGTFDTVSAPSTVITAYTQLFAWKFAIHGVDPRRPAYYDAKGNQAISGHRDVYSTECPGNALYAQLGSIRSKVISRMSPFPRFTMLEAAGDVNKDGSPDIAAVQTDGELRMYYSNRSTGLLTSGASWGHGWNTLDRILGVGDWDGDGNDDLVGRDRSTGVLYLYTGPPRGRTGYTSKVQIGSGWRLFDNIDAAGDLTGDGFPDIVANDNDGKQWVYPGDGRGGFLPRYLMGYGWYSINEIVGGQDYTGDGKDDIVGRSNDGRLYIYAGPGAPGTGYTGRIDAGAGWNAFDTIVGPGNFTPDAKPDLIARDDATNQLRIYYGAGDQGFVRGRVINSGW